MSCPAFGPVKIPLDFIRFNPMDLEVAFSFYGDYLEMGGKLQIQPYLLQIIKQYVKHEKDSFGMAVDESRVLGQFVSYIGFSKFSELVKQADNTYSEKRRS
jgi:hypothetical protein